MLGKICYVLFETIMRPYSHVDLKIVNLIEVECRIRVTRIWENGGRDLEKYWSKYITLQLQEKIGSDFLLHHGGGVEMHCVF